MGKQYKVLTPEDIAFIKAQHLFYIASASGQEVNLSPRGFDSARVISESRIIFLDYPGSGNRTARDIRAEGEVTVLFNAFSGPAQIVRLFCKGVLVEKEDQKFEEYFSLFDEESDFVRRIVELNIYAVESSCGMGVPKMQYQKERTGLQKWISSMAEQGDLQTYIDDHDVPPKLDDL
ncbi:MAG: pyridoxamine 5'-phosphate oxidase family protein [Sulfurimonadaceae bacterium]